VAQKGNDNGVDRSLGQNDWTNWQPQPSWTPTPSDTTWQPLPQKGKGKQPLKSKLWCDIHQAYGHSTDWCFENPYKSGGPPKQEWNPYKSGGPATQEWCNHHQTYGHSTEACRKGNGQAPPPQQQGHPSHANAKGGKGKTKGSSRSWKSDNFPADYDQATPALQTNKSPEWWETDAELSTVCMHSESINLKLSIFDDDELDEETATLLDLHFVSIIQQSERQRQFILNPTASLQHEIITHAQYIRFAGSLMDPIHQQVIERFQHLVNHTERQKTNEFEPTETNGIELNEKDRHSTNAIEPNETNGIELNETGRHSTTEFEPTETNGIELNEKGRHSKNAIESNETNGIELNETGRHSTTEFEPKETNGFELNEKGRHSTNAFEPNETNGIELNKKDRHSTNAFKPNETNGIELNKKDRHRTNEFEPNETNGFELNETGRHSTNEFEPNETNGIELNEKGRHSTTEFEPKETNGFELNETGRRSTHKSEMNEMDRQKANSIALKVLDKEVLLMIRDHSPQVPNEQSIQELEEEQLNDPPDPLEQFEQLNYEHDLLQMQDDIIRHMNDETDQIISAFENLDHSDSEENSEFYERVHEVTDKFYRDLHQLPDDKCSDGTVSEDDDLLENTDTEDGAEDIIDFLQSNKSLTSQLLQHTRDIARLRTLDVLELLKSNTELTALLAKQRKTIARLRARIIRLGEMITRLEIKNNHDDTTDESSSINIATTSRGYHCERQRSTPTAFVLMDSNPDVTLSTMSSKFNSETHLHFLTNTKIHREIKRKQATLQSLHEDNSPQLWMYFDSGASRSVISTTSPIREHLTQSRPVQGSCSIGDETPLEYIEKGMYNNTIDTTVVKDLHYDLFSSVSAAKLGLTSVIDYNMETGENNSYMVDKQTGNIIPLIERGRGILEVPLQLMTPRATAGADPLATKETILYAFDILKQLNERERDFLIHARLGHVPKRTILQMKKNGTKGLELYSGKFSELCKPCLQAKHRAENHGK
jgi:hypothetical protein